MKVFSLPSDCPVPEVDYKNFNMDKCTADMEAHKITVKNKLISLGYTGKLTGETVKISVADGYAEYMIADGSKFSLIHLPYLDGYSYPYISRLTKKDVINLVDHQKKIDSMFSKKAG